ncbi:chromatin target of PRMT1 protein-like isoform X2 [Galleria mellonella]|uniref:Chromatin target of PRMT1 protein-like isoform X2 n=1 Tax=Galleria mellonella TaxID=7137 RepID=A0ABM3MHQ8_GALME|nr:chromatin target of PRMT1 protein-like isoform X2 [Galleria mellonella]
MVIEKVHGLQATSMSLNDRFTMLASVTPNRVPLRQRRRTVSSYFGQNLNFKNKNLIEQIARRLEQQAKRRLGIPGGLRRFGSESSLPGLRRSNSFGNLSQAQSIKNRVSWRQSNGNLSRSASFSNLSAGAWRGFRRRGGPNRALRGRLRGGRQGAVRMWRTGRVGVGRVSAGRVGAGRAGAGRAGAGRARRQPLRPQAGASGRPRGRGGAVRNQPQKPVPTKEELDAQLDQYMAGSKSALDKELEAYMKNAMDLE